MWSGEECAGDLPKALGSAWRVCVCVCMRASVRVLHDILGGDEGVSSVRVDVRVFIFPAVK